MSATDQTTINAHVERQLSQLWEAIAEIRDGFVELDHAKANVRRVDEIHTRVEGLDAELLRRLQAWTAPDGPS